MKKSILGKFIISVFFTCIVSVIACNVSMAEEVKKEPPCYANKCYSILADCPKNCLSNVLGTITFDSSGKSNLDTSIFNGCVFLRQKRTQNEYNARLDCDNDGEADVIIKLTFLDCEENTCFKGKGIYIRKIGGEVLRDCKLNGYVVDCVTGPQNKL